MSWQLVAALSISIAAFVAYWLMGHGERRARPVLAADAAPRQAEMAPPPPAPPVDPAILARFERALLDHR